MRTKRATVLAVTLGDPGGIGAEIALKAACRSDWPRTLRLVLVGHHALLRRYSDLLRIPMPPVSHPDAPEGALPAVSSWTPPENSKRARSAQWKPGTTGRANGEAAAVWIRAAVEGCREKWFDGIVTGPICKKSLQMAGVPFPGHTEYLAHLTGTRRFAMMLIGGPLRVVLVTRHLPLSRVPAAITGEGIIEAVQLASKAVEWLGLKNSRIGICALNPHGGENGTLGREEMETIVPAVQQLKRQGFDVEGPIPADVLFYYAGKNRYGAIAAMYHDQGLAPLKMIAFERGVNITLGLPILRTSPDHGTAFDSAGKGTANPGSMIEAIRLAALLAKRGNPWEITP